MKPFTLTTAGDLKPGDQYMVEGSPVVYTVLEARCTYGGMRYVRKGELRFTDMVKKRKQVIFIGKIKTDKL